MFVCVCVWARVVGSKRQFVCIDQIVHARVLTSSTDDFPLLDEQVYVTNLSQYWADRISRQ